MGGAKEPYCQPGSIFLQRFSSSERQLTASLPSTGAICYPSSLSIRSMGKSGSFFSTRGGVQQSMKLFLQTELLRLQETSVELYYQSLKYADNILYWKWHFYKVWKQSWQEEYIEYLIHYPVFRRTRREARKEGKWGCGAEVCFCWIRGLLRWNLYVFRHLFLHFLSSFFSAVVWLRWVITLKAFPSLSLSLSSLLSDKRYGTAGKDWLLQSFVNLVSLYNQSLQIQSGPIATCC